jgi:hypothetical protein
LVAHSTCPFCAMPNGFLNIIEMSLSLHGAKNSPSWRLWVCVQACHPFILLSRCIQFNSPISVALSICNCANLTNKRQRDSVGYTFTLPENPFASSSNFTSCTYYRIMETMMDVRSRRLGVRFDVGVLRHATNSSRREMPWLLMHVLFRKSWWINFLETHCDMYHAKFMLPSAI